MRGLGFSSSVSTSRRAACISGTRLARAIAVHQLQRGVAEAALGRVDDALEGEVVGRVGDAAQIGEGVADLEPLVEARAADHPVGQAERDEALLDLAHLGGDAHEHGHLGRANAPCCCSASISSPMRRASSSLSHAPVSVTFSPGSSSVMQRLAEPALIVGDEVGGGGEDMAGGAVIALQPHDGRAGEVVLEAQDVVDLGAAPAIDRLVVVADAGDVAAALGEQAQPEILGDVGVLVLVDEDVLEALLVGSASTSGCSRKSRRFSSSRSPKSAALSVLQPLLVGGVELARRGRWRRRRPRRPAPCRASGRGSSSRR